jgi:hypothetical protein
MKSINYRIFTAALVATLVGIGACSDPEMPEPNIVTDAQPSKANFLFINASPDAPSLELYVNNEKVGAAVASGEAWTAYQNIDITANSVFANTNLRAKAASGSIGGALNGSDLIYRAGNNNSNNFQAVANVNYTIIAVDSISRPKPIRTLNSSGFGDVTYYSPQASFVAPSKLNPDTDTTIVLAVGSSNSITTVNLVKKYNGNVVPSFFVPIGIVPLGSSDPGGVRFYLLQDFFPVAADDKAGIRFVPLSPNAPTLHARLVPTAGSNLVLTGTGAAYALSQSAFNPTVGSRTVTVTAANFTLNTIATTGTPIEYTLEVSTKSDFSSNILISTPGVTFTPRKNYTIYVSGLVGDNLAAEIVQH